MRGLSAAGLRFVARCVRGAIAASPTSAIYRVSPPPLLGRQLLTMAHPKLESALKDCQKLLTGIMAHKDAGSFQQPVLDREHAPATQRLVHANPRAECSRALDHFTPFESTSTGW